MHIHFKFFQEVKNHDIYIWGALAFLGDNSGDIKKAITWKIPSILFPYGKQLFFFMLVKGDLHALCSI